MEASEGFMALAGHMTTLSKRRPARLDGIITKCRSSSGTFCGSKAPGVGTISQGLEAYKMRWPCEEGPLAYLLGAAVEDQGPPPSTPAALLIRHLVPLILLI
jgi:hypothetical protein